MSKLSDLDIDLETIRRVMEREPTAEEQIERRADFIIRELDEFCGMASNRETVDLIESQSLAFGQMQTRVQLILSFLAARHPTKFKVVSNA